MTEPNGFAGARTYCDRTVCHCKGEYCKGAPRVAIISFGLGGHGFDCARIGRFVGDTIVWEAEA